MLVTKELYAAYQPDPKDRYGLGPLLSATTQLNALYSEFQIDPTDLIDLSFGADRDMDQPRVYATFNVAPDQAQSIANWRDPRLTEPAK